MKFIIARFLDIVLEFRVYFCLWMDHMEVEKMKKKDRKKGKEQ